MQTKLFKLVISLTIGIPSLLVSSKLASAHNLGSVTSVSQLQSNFQTNWNQLSSLAQRYNCGTEGQNQNRDRSLTRAEFAVSLNSCLQLIEDIASVGDRLTLLRLERKFRPELTQLNPRLSQIESRVTQLERQQFATTTKFNGQVLTFLTDSWGGEAHSEISFGYRTRLNFDTSFSGRDLLRVRLENRDLARLDDVTDTDLSRLAVDGDTDGLTELSELSYTLSTGERTSIILGALGVSLNDVGAVLNPFSSSSSGAISRFARRDPTTLRAPGGAGLGIQRKFNDQIKGFAGYFVNNEDAANPQSGRGFFGSSHSAIAQLVLQPQDELALALTYTYAYERNNDVNLMGSTGVAAANEPFEQNATTSHNWGLQGNWEVTSGVEIGGWFGFTNAQQQQEGDANANILNGALTLAFPDLGAENNLGGIIIGIPPVISSHDDEDLVTDTTPIHLEALYRIRINDYLEITPGGFIVFNPDTEAGDTLWIGTVRTEFTLGD